MKKVTNRVGYIGIIYNELYLYSLNLLNESITLH